MTPSPTVPVPPLSQELRRAVAGDLKPVRPLPPPWRRALPLLAWAVLAVVLVVAVRGLRPDAGRLGGLLVWGFVLAEVAAGAGLVILALAESTPGRGAGRSVGLPALAGSVALFVFLALFVRRASPGVEVPDPLVTFGPSCLGMQGVIGLTALALTAFLVLRAAPLRAAFAGILAGAGAGLMAEGVYHLDCPITHLEHVLVWHGSAILLLALVGLGLGLAVERRERGRMEARRAAREGGGANS
ncbi:MAG: NrsF family protein [Thermoanaerobaculia bacterium]